MQVSTRKVLMLKQLEAYIMEQALMMPGLGQGLQAAVRVFALLPLYIVRVFYSDHTNYTSDNC